MTAGRLDQHHVKSLERLVGKGSEGLLERPLRRLFPVKTKHGVVRIGKVDWKGPYWMGASERPQWVRTLEFHVSVNGSKTARGESGHPEPKVWLSPLWPIDDSAAKASDWLTPGVRLGRASLIDGRPLVPLRQRAYKPGLHVLRNDNCAGRRRLVLVPDAGASLIINPTTMSKRGYRAAILGQFLLESGSRRPSATFGANPEEHSDNSKQFLVHFRRLVGHDRPPTAYFSVDTAKQVKASLGKYPEVSELDDYWDHLKRLCEDSNSELPDFEHELSDEVLVTRDYGDLLAEVIIESILAAVREFHELDPKAPILLERGDRDPDDAKAVELAKRINGQFYRRYRHMRSGGEHAGTRYPALVVGVDDRSTLADLEQRRKVTRYSAEIGTDTSHWTWTRGIHSRDRNQLCPLQTPESEDIGYVRFLALGEGNEYDDALGDMSDLSAAASLIPFVNHNDPARASIGSKNLKQALPIEGASRPCVRSGTETLIAGAHGVACMDNAGEATVTAVLEDRVVAEADGEEFCVLFGPPGPTGFWADGRWKTRVKVGDSVKQGDLVAHAPDVVIDDDGLPVLALGTDVLVAYTPWHGMNYEDAVVVSESIKEKFTSVHVLSISERCRSQAELPHAIVCKDDTVAKGDVLAWILSMNGERLRTVKAPEDGRVDLIDDQDPDGITIRLQARRPLAVGDKLTNRHGGKCIVSQILPASEMPELPDGRKVEMLLNPLGVIKRLNVGQLLETHVSLLDDLTPEAQLEPVGRQYGPKQRKELAEALREKGAPGGRLKLKCADGTVLDRHGGVVVGWQYMVKLDHLAIDKRTERRRIAANPRDRQPAKGRRWQGGQRRGGALRTGEMEIWALLALGADAFLNETLTERSRLSRHANATLDSVKAHLAVGQIGIDPDNGEVRLLDSRDTDRLPEEDAWLKVPSTYSYVPDQDSDVLYAEAVHGRSDEASTCSCGHESQDGYRCTECGDVAVPRESPERSQVRLRHVRLDSPVRHPWFGWSKQKEEEDRKYPFPEDEARNREERQEQALAAARAAGLEPALGLGLDDGSMVALCREKDGETVWVSTSDESRLLQLWGTRPTLLDDAKDLMIDGHRKRAFVLSPAMHEGQVTELDLNTGEFVRNWVANPYRDADLAELITLERGWPVLWGPEIGRCDCVPMLHAIPILPPAYRVFDHDWLDRRYRDLFHTITLMRNGRRDAGTLARVVRGLLGSRNDQPDAQTISGRLNSKMGLLRRGLRGRHNNSVARSVIAPDTSLGLEQVGLPKVTMDELGPEEGGLEEGKVVVVNRQPTLRPSNVIALSAYRHDGDHVALHPLMAKQLAGDFDGDEVTVHCPVSEEAADEAWERLRPTAALLSDANGEPIMKPDLDVALGLHLLSSFDDGHDQLKEFFRLCVPEVTAGEQAEQEEFFEPHVPEAMTGEQAEDLVQNWYRLMMDYNQPDRATKIHSMFELSSRACVGWSASLLELEQMDEGAFERMVDAVEDGPGIEAVGNEAAELPGWLFEAMRARAAGKLRGLKQLLVHRGEHRTLTGEVHSKINSCFLDGLSSADLFETAPAALEKLAQKKLVTPWAGVLTKRLADAMYEVIVTRADCGSPEENRTPLVCREKSGCCQACVGELVSGRTPDVNERLGLRAAMLIGERCTQGAMNTFHSGGTDDAVERAVKELEAAFGQRSHHPVEGCLSLEDAFDEDRLTFDKGRLTNIAHQVEEAVNVDGVLASLVLRQLASLNIVDKPLQAAAISEDPLVDASTAGKLSVLLDAIQGDTHRADGLRATQVYHNLDAPDPQENGPLILDAEGQYGEAGTA